MRLNVDSVIEIAKRFLRNQAGHGSIKIEDVEADKDEGEWTVIADVGFLDRDLKQVVIDDNDGNVLSYGDANEE